MDNIKVIIFDLDNTLINYGGVTKEAWYLTCQQLVASFDVSYNTQVLADTIIRENDAIWENESLRPRGNFSFYKLRKSIVTRALNSLEITDETIVEFLVKHYETCKHQAVYMFEDVPSTLKELRKRGYRIALLTNGDGATQREKLKRFDMETLFDGIFIDGEQGVGKPDKEAYDNILNQYQVKPEEACMIGDHYLWEVEAPKKYGLKAIWVNHDRNVPLIHEGVQPDASIRDILEVLTIFK